MRVEVIRHRIFKFNTVHIWDDDGRESVFTQSEIPNLIRILKKAKISAGIPIDQLDLYTEGVT